MWILLNIAAIVTFLFALRSAPATHFAVLFRTSLIFGFVLSLVLLREFKAWRWKVTGAAFILVGSVFFGMSAA